MDTATAVLTFTPAVDSSAPYLTSLTISNIKEHPVESEFQIAITGIKNPDSSVTGLSSGWKIQTELNGFIIDELADFDEFPYGSAFSPRSIIFNEITAYPLNAGEIADYTVKFTPVTEIPSRGKILVIFPIAQYPALPDYPECKLAGGLTTFSACERDGQTVTIVTNMRYQTGQIELTIRNVLNPAEGTSDGFQIKTFYDNIYLDTTSEDTLDGRTITISAKPGYNNNHIHL